VVVDPDHPGLDAARHPLALLAVPGPDRGAEAELGVVGELDRLGSESTVTIGSTGPKISSFMIRISWVTPVRTVGAMNLPGLPSTSTGAAA
jgi:hypothetical protein